MSNTTTRPKCPTRLQLFLLRGGLVQVTTQDRELLAPGIAPSTRPPAVSGHPLCLPLPARYGIQPSLRHLQLSARPSRREVNHCQLSLRLLLERMGRALHRLRGLLIQTAQTGVMSVREYLALCLRGRRLGWVVLEVKSPLWEAHDPPEPRTLTDDRENQNIRIFLTR